MYEFGIEVSVKDVQLLYKIKNLLGVGSILFRYKERKEKDLEKINNMVIYRVRNKSHLKEIILPIFDKYPMLSSKQFDYIRFKSHLLSGVIYSKDLLHYNRPKLPINSMKNMINSYYFPAWLVGFIEAESSFSIYKPSKDSSLVASFEITQTNGEILMLAICTYLKLSGKIGKDFTNNFKIKVSSIRNIENIIKFMNKAPIKLLGYKKTQYLLWLKNLRTIPRYYTKINIPFYY
jgi:hypothetical protein